MAKPGLKTEAGKAIVRLNAVRHGVLSTTPVIPGLEREEDWEAHRVGVIDSLNPKGHLESSLAERVALQLWRLQRVARYEREVISVAQERVEDDLAEQRRVGTRGPESVEKRARISKRRRRAFVSLSDCPNCRSRSHLVVRTRWRSSSVTQKISQGLELHEVRLPDAIQGIDLMELEMFEGWTAGLLRETIAALADHAELETKDLLEAIAEVHRGFVRSTEQELDRTIAELDRMRRQRLLPPGEILQTLVRYEAHLNRQLYQAMHELEALQTRRQGEPAPLARVDVQGLPQE